MASKPPQSQWCVKITKKSCITLPVDLKTVREWFGENTDRIKQDGPDSWLIAYDSEDHCREHIDFAEENTDICDFVHVEVVYTLWAITENDLLLDVGSLGV
ncbi:Protein of unknown function [Pyronema omphalodes CBS 100304]|uniref:Uncharacterized protein n=1 Tax=Pyronema omphalodes (strain CBS 100304) TaxID=1076935 RepID=U4KWH6_PYROM|nr:Protein of unknown function [Pyronema omphalodes CBS 100304]